MTSSELYAMVGGINGILITILLFVLNNMSNNIKELASKLDHKVNITSCKDIRTDCFKTCPTRQHTYMDRDRK